jgi:3-deoxy-manno-octulosonate cytidylyltransferase (CMP-KDO synthetase)
VARLLLLTSVCECCVKLMRMSKEELRSHVGRVVAVIPARMGSSRFPGKPLAPLLGRPMIEHVARRALMCDLLDAVYVATCDEEIRSAVEQFGGEAIMTSPTHERASDRVAEAAENFEAEVVVMIQGDEPMVTPSMIAAAVAPFAEDAAVSCVNLARRIDRREEYFDRNTIKVTMNARGDALYFSRAPIPADAFARETDGVCPPVFKQVCVIPFRRDFLHEFARLPQTPLERAESIDMLRAIEHGRPVRLVLIEEETHAVDTAEDLRLVEALMTNDPLVRLYADARVRGGRRV